MSTIAYAELTNRRDDASPGTSMTTSPPGVSTYVDALAALVPAEVLALHALIISATTVVVGDTTTIEDATTLRWAFWALAAFSAGLYAVPRWLKGHWDKLDFLRVLIPPAAFVGWTMLQRATAFDAAFPSLAQSPRTVIGLFFGAVLGALAIALAYKADQKRTS